MKQEEAGPRPWEKQEWETGKAYQSFCAYRDSGYGSKGERQGRPTQEEFIKARGGHYKAPRPGHWTHWFAGYDRHGEKRPGYSWQDRAAAYDVYLEARSRAKREEELLRRQERIREIDWQRVTAGLDSNLVAIRLLRQAMGQPVPNLPELQTSEEYQKLPVSTSQERLLALLGGLAQHELDVGLKAVRADAGLLEAQSRVQHTGSEGGPMVHVLAQASLEEAQRLRALREKLRDGEGGSVDPGTPGPEPGDLADLPA